MLDIDVLKRIKRIDRRLNRAEVKPPGFTLFPVTGLTVEEQDGTPTVTNVTTIKICDGTLTNEGAGVVSIACGCGSSGSALVDFVFAPHGESGSDDYWWRYTDGTWTSGSLPQAGWYWKSLKIDPSDNTRWLLLGFPTNTLIGSPTNRVYLTEDAGATWNAISLTMPGGATTNGDWVDMAWLYDGSYVIVCYDDTAINAPINWWTGTGLTGTAYRDTAFNRLLAISDDGNGGVLISDGNGPSGVSTTLGRIVGGTASAVCLDYSGVTNPAGPLDVKPTTTTAYMANVSGIGTAGLHELYPIDTAPTGTDNVVTGGSSVLWTSAGTDALFVAVDLSGFSRVTWADLAGTGVPGTPGHSAYDPESIRVGRASRSVAVGYGQTVAATRKFSVYNGTSWSDVDMPSGTFNDLATGRAIPYDVFDASDPCAGCPPSAHAENHCATGCDPIDISCLSGQIATAQIADDAVTFAKMQNISTDRLLGRDTAGTGDVEQLTVSGGIEFTGSGGIQRSALTGDATASAGSNATSVVKLQGRTLASTAPSGGQAIVWNSGSSQWEPGSAGATTLDGLTDVTITSPADADRLRYDAGSSLWKNSAKIWEPLTNGDVTTPELIFAGGDVVMVEV